MGLDNGLYVINYPEEFKRNTPKDFSLGNDDDNYIEFAYWRKCWNLRNEIIALPIIGNGLDYKVTIEDLKAIRSICIKYLDPEYYNRHSDDMLWTYDELYDSQRTIVKNIIYVIDSWEKYPNIEVYFYDSY